MPKKPESEPLFPIAFTQFLYPHGAQQQIWITRPKAVFDKAQLIFAAMFTFCAEKKDGWVTFTITDDFKDYEFALVLNGPAITDAVDQLILNFEIQEALNERELHFKSIMEASRNSTKH